MSSDASKYASARLSGRLNASGSFFTPKVSPLDSSDGKLERQLPAPRRLPPIFLVHRDAFGQPSRHAVLGQLQRVHVRQFVPQRGLPAEVARRPRARRIHGDDAAEARAERAHAVPRSPMRAHGKLVVDRKHFDQDRPFGREAVARAERLARLLGQRHRVGLEHGGLGLLELEDEVAGRDGLERVDADRARRAGSS